MAQPEIEISKIKVPEGRQRKEFIDIEPLARSISRIGLIHPITIRPDGTLVAGERRLRAFILLKKTHIPYLINESEDPTELQLVEFEENTRRKDLTWQEQCDAVAKLHSAYSSIYSDWTLAKTSGLLNLSDKYIGQLIDIDKRLKAGDKELLAAKKISEAGTVISRRNARALESLRNELTSPTKGNHSSVPLICADFNEWSSTYSGPKFDFIHCDFPYGIDLQDSDQVSSAFSLYEDDKDVYFQLLDSFTTNIDRFCLPAAHIMFWFSMKFFNETVEALSSIGNIQDEYPLIWMKSDNKGIASDPHRRPRRIYETALVVSRGDRQTRKLISNAIALPTEFSRFHISTKPKEVLRYFFQAFVDENTCILDPTCGSANALIVAKEMKAKAILGIEKNEEFVNQVRLDL